jgi:outer membrane protein TolC
MNLNWIFVFIFLTGCMQTDRELTSTRFENAQEDWVQLIETPALENAILTLDDILKRVLERNLDLLVKEMEYAYQYELATGSKLKMIPPLVLTGEVSGRNRNTGMFSKSLQPGVPPAPPSISSEQHVNRYDITFTWNLLDFGISYFRARQAADKASVKQMEYARVRQKLIQDTIEEYWKARTALLGLTKSQSLIDEAHGLLAFINAQIEKQILPKDKSLYREKQIYRQEIQMQLYEREYHRAMTELARLMGSPQADFELLQEEIVPITLELPSPEILEGLALMNRPELYGLDIEERTVSDEAKIALMQIFPNLSPFIGNFFDSNFYLIYHRWIYGGLRYTWNLLAMPYHIQDYLSELEHVNVVQYERLALSIGILTQVNLAWIAYEDSKQEYKLVQDLANTNQDLLHAVNLRQLHGEMSQGDVLIDYRYDAIFSEVEALRAYGILQTTIAQINSSIGIPFYLSPGVSCHE